MAADTRTRAMSSKPKTGEPSDGSSVAPDDTSDDDSGKPEDHGKDDDSGKHEEEKKEEHDDNDNDISAEGFTQRYLAKGYHKMPLVDFPETNPGVLGIDKDNGDTPLVLLGSETDVTIDSLNDMYRAYTKRAFADEERRPMVGIHAKNTSRRNHQLFESNGGEYTRRLLTSFGRSHFPVLETTANKWPSLPPPMSQFRVFIGERKKSHGITSIYRRRIQVPAGFRNMDCDTFIVCGSRNNGKQMAVVTPTDVTISRIYWRAQKIGWDYLDLPPPNSGPSWIPQHGL